MGIPGYLGSRLVGLTVEYLARYESALYSFKYRHPSPVRGWFTTSNWNGFNCHAVWQQWLVEDHFSEEQW